MEAKRPVMARLAATLQQQAEAQRSRSGDELGASTTIGGDRIDLDDHEEAGERRAEVRLCVEETFMKESISNVYLSERTEVVCSESGSGLHE